MLPLILARATEREVRAAIEAAGLEIVAEGVEELADFLRQSVPESRGMLSFTIVYEIRNPEELPALSIEEVSGLDGRCQETESGR